MKILFITLIISLSSLVVMAQTYSVGVSGFVEDIETNEPIGGQMVHIMTDSVPSNFFYYNTVLTDESGFFEDSFEVPSGVSGDLFVSTAGCQGSMLIEQVAYSENSTDFTFTFLSCSDPGGGGEDCEAMFYYYPEENSQYTIQFMDASSGYPDSWSWDFGDGNSSTEQNPIHAYNDEGEYNVNLTISSDSLDCTSTIDMLVLVGDSIWFPPDSCVAMFYAYPNQEDFLTMNFVDMSIGNGNTPPDNWFWSFGDGTSSSEQNPTHIFASEGSYEVCLTISLDDSSCMNTFCEIIEVTDWNDGCQAQFYYYPGFDSLPSGNDLVIQFFDYSLGNPSSWDWDFGDGNISTEQNPIHIYADTGIYEVCLSIANPEDSCFSTYCQEVYVFNDTLMDCLAWFEYTLADSIGLTIDFTGYSLSNEQSGDYLWDFGDGTSGTGQAISHSYTEEDLYTVTMTYSDSINGCYTVYTDVIWLGNDFNFEVFGYVMLEDSLMADLADVYLMTFDTIDGNLVAVDETEIDENGYYEFEEVGLENCIYFVQAELQQASLYNGEYVPTYHYDALSWQDAWPVFPFPTGSGYNVMMIAADAPELGGGHISGTVSTEVRGTLENVEVVLLDENNNPMAYTRTDASGHYSFANIALGSYLLHIEIPGISSVPMSITLSDENPSETLDIIIRDSEAVLGVNDAVSTSLQKVSNVFPNPVTESAFIEIEVKESSNVSITLRNSVGYAIYQETTNYNPGLHRISITMRDLPGGIYLIDIRSEDGTRIVKKLVKL